MSGDPLKLALNKLKYRLYSKREIQEFLLASCISPDQVAEVLEKLEGWGYLDDEGLGRQIMAHYARTKPLGRYYLARKLQSRGLDAEKVEFLMNDYGEEVELEAAIRLAEKYISGKKANLSGDRMSLARYLSARGFSRQVISKVISQILSFQG